MSDNPLMNIGDLAEPAKVLIEKIADATGALYEPKHIVEVAKAQAEAAKIQAESEIEIAKSKAEVVRIQAESEIETTDLQRRALQRWIVEQGQQQASIENTITKAIPQLNEDADPHAIEDDWIIKFFDKSRLVTDDEVQDLWASILAGEANSKGSYSPKTLTTLADMSQKDLISFNAFCSLCLVNLEDPNAFLKSPSNFKIRDAIMPVIKKSATSNIEELNSIYQRYGLGSNELQLLLEHGLIQDSLTKIYTRFGHNNKIWGFQSQDSRTKSFTKVRLSGYSLSNVGKELFHITKRNNPSGYSELLIRFLKRYYKVNVVKCGPR